MHESILNIACQLEEISTQNGLFKKNNKIKTINFGGTKEKTTFFVRIFDISPCVFTQIMSERAHWMRNLIPHPMSTNSASNEYPHCILLTDPSTPKIRNT